jgi:predicted ribosomally synthesized peptide with SipW-like signal peptide
LTTKIKRKPKQSKIKFQIKGDLAMKKSKVLITVLCVVLLVTVSVLGTLAYLTSQDEVVNTFTVGKVKITLDEADVNEDGTEIVGADRVKENNYHLIPGKTYKKDPTLTVKAKSEDSYVRMLLTIDHASEFDAIYAPNKADLTTIFNGYDANNWVCEGVTGDSVKNTVTYEFRYKEIVRKSDTDTILDTLFDSITVPSTFDSADMASIVDLKITVIGHAIQATGFANEDAAWTAFDEQING